ncbi:MAG: hypothetical protein KDE08_14730 [Rhodobacteraceae bacterium]|nr:hypothetical protein [Paracoccaceae bacterium]
MDRTQRISNLRFPARVVARAFFALLVALGLWLAIPAMDDLVGTDHGAATAKGSNSGSGGGGSGGGSGSGSGSDDDDDDDDDDDSGNSGHGSGNSGSGSSGSGSSGSSSSGSSSSSGKSGHGKSVITGGNLQIQFADGHIERILGDQFQTLDAQGHITASRSAQSIDRARLEGLSRSLASGAGGTSVLVVLRFNPNMTSAEILDFRGWREVLDDGAYVLTDPDGRLVKSRRVKSSDLKRLRALLGL